MFVILKILIYFQDHMYVAIWSLNKQLFPSQTVSSYFGAVKQSNLIDQRRMVQGSLILGTKIAVLWIGIATPSTAPPLPLWHTTSHRDTKLVTLWGSWIHKSMQESILSVFKLCTCGWTLISVLELLAAKAWFRCDNSIFWKCLPFSKQFLRTTSQMVLCKPSGYQTSGSNE